MPEALRTSTFIATYDPSFADLAGEELRSAADPISSYSELEPGILLVESAIEFQELANAWQNSPPVFVRHICPVHLTLQLSNIEAVAELLASAVMETFAPHLDPMLEFSVQTRILGDSTLKPFDINTALSSALTHATGSSLNVRQPQQVLSVVSIADRENEATNFFAGLSLASQNISDWAGGMRRFAREPQQVSRSEFKLLEAIEFFGIDLQPRSVALDLGAAPGGWTRVLRQHEIYVTAVDPGALHKSIHTDSGVRHIRMTAEEYLDKEPEQFDIIVNDMRMDGRDSSRLMLRYAPYLYRHGCAIMTLKLPERHRAACNRACVDHSAPRLCH